MKIGYRESRTIKTREFENIRIEYGVEADIRPTDQAGLIKEMEAQRELITAKLDVEEEAIRARFPLKQRMEDVTF